MSLALWLNSFGRQRPLRVARLRFGSLWLPIAAPYASQFAMVLTVIITLASSGLPPQRLGLEITESILIVDISAALATLHGSRKLGVRRALEDFATGYSSLSYLCRFPFDTVKIDCSFVENLVTSANGDAIIRAISSLAGALGWRHWRKALRTSRNWRCLDGKGVSMSRDSCFRGLSRLDSLPGCCATAPVVSASCLPGVRFAYPL